MLYQAVEYAKGIRYHHIYILCAEGLSAIIRRNEETGLLHGYRITKGAPVILHLLFTDDCYCFSKPQ